MTTLALVAQLVGLLGFVLMLVATQQRQRLRLLALDVTGILLVSVHWVLLEEYGGAAFNTVFALISGLGLMLPTNRTARILYWLLYPLVVGLFWTINDPVQVLAATGTLTAVVGIHQQRLRRLRAILTLSGSQWMVYGALAGSVGQVVFGLLFVGGHIRQLLRPSSSAGASTGNSLHVVENNRQEARST